jgi:pyruvate formate lyase activating enzyme
MDMDRRTFLKGSAVTLFLPCWTNPQVHATEEEFPLAQFFRQRGNHVICELCPHDCEILPGERGFCGVRENHQGYLRSHIFGQTYTKMVAPLEQIPFYHFLPNALALVVGTPGCNMDCPYCHTSLYSQRRPEDVHPLVALTPEELVQEALSLRIEVLAFSFTEPLIAYEWILETARYARLSGVKVVLNTNGFIHPNPLEKLAPFLSACQVDIKAFRAETYEKILKGKLETVLESLRILKKHQVWIEIFVLLIEGINDNEAELQELFQFVKNDLGDIPVFLGRFQPSYKMIATPETSEELLKKGQKIAQKNDLNYIYASPQENRPSTICPRCKMTLILREKGTESGVQSYYIHKGQCPSCYNAIPGIWDDI